MRASFQLSSHSTKSITLVELLVVIAVIAIMLALLMPVLSRAQEQTQTVQCMNNQRQVVAVLALFAGEHDGYLPDFWNEPAKMYWFHYLTPYLPGSAGKILGYDFMRCPSAPNSGFATLGVDYGGSGSFTTCGPFRTSDGPQASFHIAKVTVATILTSDTESSNVSYQYCLYNPNTYYFTEDYDGDGVDDTCGINGLSKDYTPYNAFAPRHPGQTAICSFPNGSVRKIPLKEWLQNTGNIWGAKD